MKRVMVALGLMLCMAAPAFAVDFAFHGDLNNRSRLVTNHAEFTNGLDQSTSFAKKAIINDGTGSDFLVDYKYRLWTEAASDDGAIKGVFAIEVAESFGNSDTTYSGDSKDSLKVRWAWTDFAVAGGRLTIGLQNVAVNHYFWEETAAGIHFKKDVGAGSLEVAWYRPNEVRNTSDNNDFKDQDALYLRYNMKPAEATKVGFFGCWITSDGLTSDDFDQFEAQETADQATLDAAKAAYNASAKNAADLATLEAAQAAFSAADDVPGNWYVKKMSTSLGGSTIDMDLYTVGIDGSTKAGNFFANWDLMYQFGDYAEAADFGGYFAHFDLGMKMGKGKLTYTFWYASGDDDRDDSDLDAFVAVDVDMFESVVFFESYTDSNYFSATPYLQDKGMIFNRIKYDYQVTDKLKVGAAAIYMMTAEDLEYDDNGADGIAANGDDVARKDDKIGLEFDAYISYQLFSKTEFAVEAGYLMAGDVMDFYEADCDGNSDEDIWLVDTRLRYKF